MAKTLARFAGPRPVIVNIPRPAGRIRRGASRAVRYVRTRGRAHARAAMPTVAVTLGGAIAGYLQGSGRLDFLPEIGGSKMVTLGLVGWGATRFTRNHNVRAAGLAALAAAAFDFGRVQGGGTHGDWGWE